jgi:N-hydroxyarylamine O-acetyltransferase
LRAVHAAHLMAVPFENLDIGLGRAIELDEAALFAKIVRRGRGGFCYELNGLFAALLRGLGFDVTLLSARVYSAGVAGPDFDHLTLRVRPADGSAWLADVGFGDSFVEPLRLATGEQADTGRGRTYRLLHHGDEWLLEECRAAASYEARYSFTSQPRRMEDFGPMCHYQQTSPDSHFTQQRVISRATPTGRITLRDHRLIVHDEAGRTETALPDDRAYAAALRAHFGINHV